MKGLQIATLASSLVSMVILIAVAAKLQVARDEATKAVADFTASPFKAVMNLIKGS